MDIVSSLCEGLLTLDMYMLISLMCSSSTAARLGVPSASDLTVQITFDPSLPAEDAESKSQAVH
eukprot:766215-Hanusia_phi.AAC.2